MSRADSVRNTLRDPYWLVCAVLFLLAIAYAVRRPWSGDLGMHAATVERLRQSLTNPGDPLVNADVDSPYYSPYTLLLALGCRVTGSRALTALSVAGPINVLLLLIGVRAVVRTLTPRRLAPLLALAGLLVLWGPKPRVWSGFLSWWSLPLVMSFPSTLALALTLLLWAGLVGVLRQTGRGYRYLGLGLLAGVIALVHQFTFAIAALGVLAVLVGRARGLRRAIWAWLAGGAAVAVALLLVWPYYSFFALFGVGGLDAIHRPLYDRPWVYFGLALPALPALWLRWRRSRLDPLVLLFVACVVVVAVGWFGHRYAYGRIWPGVLLSAHLALGVELAGVLSRRGVPRQRQPHQELSRQELPRRGRSRQRLARAWVLVAGLAAVAGLITQSGNLLYLAPKSLVTPGVRAHARMYLAWPDYSWLTAYIAPGDVVLTDNYFAVRTIPAYGARTVAPAWPDPLLPDEAQRRAAVRMMTNPDTPGVVRHDLARRYHVRWVLEFPGQWSISAGQSPAAVGPTGQRLYLVTD